MKPTYRCSRIPAVALQSVSGRYRLPALLRAEPRAVLAAGRGPASEDAGPSSADAEAQKLTRVEAVLFLAREPLSSRKLSQYANLADGTEGRTLVRRLNEKLDGTGRAFRVEEVAGGFQLTTRPQFASWLRRMEHIPAQERLSAPSMETLAVIAYRQPVIRAEIESIRGVSCGEVLNQLMNRDLVRVGGRSDELGRPYLYNTTKRFLQVFGLRSLDDLPRAEQLRGAVLEPDAARPGTPAPEGDPNSSKGDMEVEEDPDVSVSVELETHSYNQQPSPSSMAEVDERHVRMEDEDFEELEEDEEDEDFEDFEDYDEDEEFEEEEDGDVEGDEEEEFEEEEYDDDVEADEEEYDDEELEDDWEEVEGEEDEDADDEEDEDDWEDDDWEDDEEWEED